MKVFAMVLKRDCVWYISMPSEITVRLKQAITLYHLSPFNRHHFLDTITQKECIVLSYILTGFFVLSF